MPKAYYAYIPFVPDENTAELVAAVGRWQANVDTARREAGLKQAQIRALTATNLRETTERGQRMDNLAKIALLETELRESAVPDVRKRPILLQHDNGVTQPLRVLAGISPDDYVLYIVGHCAPGSTELRNTQSVHTRTDPLKSEKLVARLALDGMPREILNVKLLACFGARPDPGHHLEAYSSGLWKHLRGYCTTLVKLTAYAEPVLITSFYAPGTKDATGTHKAFAPIVLGEVLPSSVASGGKLSSAAKKYVSRKCPECPRAITVACSECKVETCRACSSKHLDEGGICRMGK